MSMLEMGLKIVLLKLEPLLPGVNELTPNTILLLEIGCHAVAKILSHFRNNALNADVDTAAVETEWDNLKIDLHQG